MIREDLFKIQVADSSTIQQVSSKKRPLEIETSEGERSKKRGIIFRTVEKSGDQVDEISKYEEKFVFVVENEELLLCDWWKQNAEVFPKLSKLFRKIMCAPASVGIVEGRFSLGSFLINQKRSSLNPPTVDNMLFLKSHFDDTTI